MSGYRGVSFDEVAQLIAQGLIIEIIASRNQLAHPGQKTAVLEIRGYIYLVPFVETSEGLFLKTIIPSRKATKKFGGRYG